MLPVEEIETIIQQLVIISKISDRTITNIIIYRTIFYSHADSCTIISVHESTYSNNFVDSIISNR